MLLYGWKLLIVSLLSKFAGLRPYCSTDITGLIFHVTLQDHMIAGLCGFMEGSSSLSSLYIPTLPSISLHGRQRYCGRGYIIVLVFPVISQNHVTKGLSVIMDKRLGYHEAGSPSWSPSMGYRHYSSDNIMILVVHIMIWPCDINCRRNSR